MGQEYQEAYDNACYGRGDWWENNYQLILDALALASSVECGQLYVSDNKMRRIEDIWDYIRTLK